MAQNVGHVTALATDSVTLRFYAKRRVQIRSREQGRSVRRAPGRRRDSTRARMRRSPEPSPWTSRVGQLGKSSTPVLMPVQLNATSCTRIVNFVTVQRIRANPVHAGRRRSKRRLRPGGNCETSSGLRLIPGQANAKCQLMMTSRQDQTRIDKTERAGGDAANGRAAAEKGNDLRWIMEQAWTSMETMLDGVATDA